MNRKISRATIICLLAILAVGIAACRGQSTAPDTKDAERCDVATSERTATEQNIREGVDPKILAALDRLEKLGETVKDLQAKLTLEKWETLVDDRTIKEGQLYYQRNEKEIRFRVSFDVSRHGKQSVSNPEHFVFTGGWLTYRQERGKREDRYQVTRPGQPSSDLMRIGKSPLPIPIGQKTEDVLKNFEVSLIEQNEQTDPPEIKTVHLKLVPRKGTELAVSHTRLEFWLAEPDCLVVRSQWENDSGDIFTADMNDIQVNKGIKDKIFQLPKLPRGYEVEDWPLPEEPEEKNNLPPGP